MNENVSVAYKFYANGQLCVVERGIFRNEVSTNFFSTNNFSNYTSSQIFMETETDFDRNNDINNMYNGKFEIERIRILQSCIEGFNKPCLGGRQFRRVVRGGRQ